VKDSYSGLITGNTPSGSFQYPFMRRENPDIIITPLNQANSVDSVHIAWDKNFKIRYVAITSIRNTGFVSTELPLISAYHTNDGDVFSSLFQTDSLYTYINPNSYIILDFQNIENPGSGGTRDYIFEVNGKVIFLGNTEIKQNLLSTIKNEDKLEYKLSQNYPNPFNPVTKINFSLPKQGFATLKVYDILGREVRILINEMKQAGNYSVDFDASHLSSGIYFYRLESGSFSNVKKMILIK